MNIVRLTLFSIVGTVLSASAARGAEALSVEDLRLNTAPAFVLLGTTPTAVEQPGSPRAFAASLFASQDDNSAGRVLPRNLALEFAPYWWFYGKELTWDEYQKNDALLANLGRTLTFSVATAEAELPTPAGTSDGTGIGLGFRVNLWKGQPSAAAVNAKNALSLKLKDIAAELPDDPDQPIPIDSIKSKYEIQLKDYREAIRRRDGFQLELAGGGSWGYPGDDFDAGVFKSGGVWVTPAYRSSSDGPAGDFQFVGVGRYLHHNLEEGDASSFDAGARVVWMIPSKLFTASAEFVHRFSEGNGTESSRYAGTVEYQVSDRLALLLGFGRDFKSMVTKEDSTFVLLGLNFAILDAKARK
jgi:hypothetical protein